MGLIEGTRFPWSDSANVGIDMSDTLSMLKPSDVPILSLIGKSGLTATELKHEWLEDALRPLDSTVVTLGELGGVTDPADDVVCTTGHGAYFRAGDIVAVVGAAGTELVRVAATPAADTLNLVRGYGGSSILTHTGLPALKIIGNVNVTDAAVGAARTTTKTGLYNYCQLYEDAVTVTSTTQAIKKYVEQNDLDAQMTRAITAAWMQYERTLLYGRKVAPSAGVAGAMDGILVRLTTNAYAKAGAALSEPFILQALQDCWTAGGNPDTVCVGAYQKRQLNTFLDSQRMTTRTDRIAGSVVDTYTSDFGTVDIVLARQMPTDTVLIIDRERIKFGPLTGFSLSAAPIPKTTRLTETMQIVGQYTSETRNESAHAKITGLATS
jgi:hypothetical protein